MDQRNRYQIKIRIYFPFNQTQNNLIYFQQSMSVNDKYPVSSWVTAIFGKYGAGIVTAVASKTGYLLHSV